MTFREALHNRAKRLERTVVLAEGWDSRVAEAGRQLEQAGLARVLVLDPDRLPRVDDVATLLRTRRPDRVPDEDRAHALASDPIVLAAGLVALGANATVS